MTGIHEVAQMVKNPPGMQETQVQSLGQGEYQVDEQEKYNIFVPHLLTIIFIYIV